MRDATDVRAEYKKVCQAMGDLEKKGGGRNAAPLPADVEVYMRLYTIKSTLEWVRPRLIKTQAKGKFRFSELAGHKHWVFGPTFAVLHP